MRLIEWDYSESKGVQKMNRKPIIPYEEIGPDVLSRLVDAFYEKVAAHPKLKPIFPDDLTETARKQ